MLRYKIYIQHDQICMAVFFCFPVEVKCPGYARKVAYTLEGTRKTRPCYLVTMYIISKYNIV